MVEEERQGTARRGRIRAAAAAALAGLVLAVAPAVAHAAVLDANCPGPPNATLGPNLGDSREAQTFAMTRDGTLTNVKVALQNKLPGGAFQIQILGVDANGLPINGALSGGTVPDAAVPNGQSLINADLNPPLPVRAGEVLALAVTRPGGNLFTFQARNDNPCQGGSFFSFNQTGTWSVDEPNTDLIFQTFVETSTFPRRPSNDFDLVQKRGRLFARVPGPGKVIVDDAQRTASASRKRKKHRDRGFLKRTKAIAHKAGDVLLKVELTKKAIRHVLRTHKLNTYGAVTYTPKDGEPNTLTFRIKLKI